MNGMSVAVKTVSKILFPFFVVFGFYLALHGHISHGIGFAGGVFIALAFILMMLAAGTDALRRRVTLLRASLAMNLMAAALVLIGLTGSFYGAGYFGNFIALGKPFALFSSGIIIVSK